MVISEPAPISRDVVASLPLYPAYPVARGVEGGSPPLGRAEPSPRLSHFSAASSMAMASRKNGTPYVTGLAQGLSTSRMALPPTRPQTKPRSPRRAFARRLPSLRFLVPRSLRSVHPSLRALGRKTVYNWRVTYLRKCPPTSRAADPRDGCACPGCYVSLRSD